MKQQEITRERLYELLWEKPITKLAEEFNVRPLEIVTAADHAAVPRPPSGYWTQLTFGKATDPPPLPDSPKGQTGVILLPAPREIRTRAHAKSERQGDESIDAPKNNPYPSAANRHRFVLSTAKALKAQKALPPQFIVSSLHEAASIDVRVRKENFERTLGILEEGFQKKLPNPKEVESQKPQLTA